MWTRFELKTNAKTNLRGKYWSAFAAALIVSLLGGGSSYFGYQFDSKDFEKLQINPGNLNTIFTNPWVVVIAALVSVVAIIGILYTIFIAAVIQVGGNRWFSRSRETAGVPSLGQIFSQFRNGGWLPTAGAMFWMNLWLFIWSLLPLVFIMAGSFLLVVGVSATYPGYIPNGMFDFNLNGVSVPWLAIGFALLAFGLVLLVPAIIKSYSYRMTPWILADNPRIGARRALKLSMKMTRGSKLEIFVLDLSFIGWFLLGVMACGIGVLFVMPYYFAVMAELYAALRSNAVQQEFAAMEDFGYVKVTPPEAT